MSRFDPSRLAFRLAILAVGASVPFLAIIFWLIGDGINRTITAAEAEIQGNAFQRPLEHLLDAVPRHQIAVKRGATEIGAIDAEIDQAFLHLDRVADLYGDDLHFVSNDLEERHAGRLRVPLVRERWRSLTSATSDGSGYDRLVSDLRAMILYAGNSSKLALDPDLDSSALIDVTLRELPEAQDQLARLLREVLEPAENTGPEQSRRRIAARAALKTATAQIERDLEVMLAEDLYFYGIHVPLHVQVAEEGKQVAQTIGTFLQREEAGRADSPEELLSLGMAARTACHHFWTTSVEQVDRLLAIRIKAQRAKRTQALFLTSLMVILAGFVGWKLGDKMEAERVANRCAVTVEDEKRDEPIAPTLPVTLEWTTYSAQPIDRVRIDTLPPQKSDWKEY